MSKPEYRVEENFGNIRVQRRNPRTRRWETVTDQPLRYKCSCGHPAYDHDCSGCITCWNEENNGRN